MSADRPPCLYGGPKDFALRGQWLPAPERRLTVLNFSGGKQSSLLAWMAIRGEIERPDVILTANPGMEGDAVLQYVSMIHARAREVGIPAYTVPGPNLFSDMIGLRTSGRTRFDTPAYYTQGDSGGREGKLTQRCTKYYKIEPMNRAARRELERKLGIKAKGGRIPPGTVEKWIGFSASEVHRIKPPKERWSCFRYPLVDMNLTNGDVVKWYQRTGTPMPPRSVCRACFANDAAFFKQMSQDDPAGWQQALAVDEAIRDWTQIGVKRPVYILRSCISLRELQARDFQDNGGAGDSCDSGFCFT